MSIAFDKAVQFVLKHEGGATVTEDPDDPGGLTKYGISQRSYPTTDIRALTEEQAIEIYRADYWNKCKCDELPEPLAVATFDSAVNQGPSTAIKILQESLGVKADGVIGSQTIAAAAKQPAGALTDMITNRMLKYAGLSTFSKYGKGWFRRAVDCHKLALDR